jgi:hypothetical protein
MHLRRLGIVLGFFVALRAEAAVIYKWTDANGVVHYSDQAVPGAEPITVSGGNSKGIVAGVTGAQVSANPQNKATPTSLANAVFTISSPAKEQVFFNDQAVSAHVDINPALAPTQTLTWELNGTALTDQGPNAVSFVLPTLTRGTYTLTATLADPNTGESRTDSVTFYVRQPSELSPLHR